MNLIYKYEFWMGFTLSLSLVSSSDSDSSVSADDHCFSLPASAFPDSSALLHTRPACLNSSVKRTDVNGNERETYLPSRFDIRTIVRHVWLRTRILLWIELSAPAISREILQEENARDSDASQWWTASFFLDDDVSQGDSSQTCK